MPAQQKSELGWQAEVIYAGWFNQKTFDAPPPHDVLFRGRSTGIHPNNVGFDLRNSQMQTFSCYRIIDFKKAKRLKVLCGLGYERIALNLVTTKEYRQRVEYLRDSAYGTLSILPDPNGYSTPIDTHTTWKGYVSRNTALRVKIAFAVVRSFKINVSAGVPLVTTYAVKYYDDYRAHRPQNKTLVDERVRFFQTPLSTLSVFVSGKLFSTSRGEMEMQLGWAQLSVKQPMVQVGLSYSHQ